MTCCCYFTMYYHWMRPWDQLPINRSPSEINIFLRNENKASSNRILFILAKFHPLQTDNVGCLDVTRTCLLHRQMFPRKKGVSAGVICGIVYTPLPTDNLSNAPLGCHCQRCKSSVLFCIWPPCSCQAEGQLWFSWWKWLRGGGENIGKHWSRRYNCHLFLEMEEVALFKL